ncbi:hypothetical protein OF83DRAFT_1116570 [Amylostereum chailletii]|nr:hypothetical protein OF83DRAFT_1116570 [Amylostereum chailletii]
MSTSNNDIQNADDVQSVRSPDVWFGDGDIVLRVTSGTVHTLFKVDKCLLSRYSTFFSAAFEEIDKDVGAESERYEGTLILDMHGDAAEDVRDLLLAIYKSGFLHQHRKPGWYDNRLPTPAFPTIYSGALSLAVQYIFEDVQSIILDHIREAWPTTLNGWDARSLKLCADELPMIQECRWDLTPVHPDPSATIRMGVDHNLTEILPVAYYDLCRISDNYNPDVIPGEFYRWPCCEALRPAELRRLMSGRRSLHRDFHTIIDDPFLVHCSQNCRRLEEQQNEGTSSLDHAWNWPCKKGLVRWWKLQFEVCRYDVPDPLDWLLRTSNLTEAIEDGEACEKCRTWFKSHILFLRQTMWTNLPHIFDLSDDVPSTWGTS